MQISYSVPRCFTLASSPVLTLPDVLPATPRPTRRTLAQLHRDLFRSRYSGADLRRLAGDPNRRECRRRRRGGWRQAVGLTALSPTRSEA